MAPQPLFTAILTEDLAEHILPLLPLASLGSLLCASRATRTWVDGLQESVWQVRRAAVLQHHNVCRQP